MPEPILLCWSGGKDSAMALYEIKRNAACEVVGLLTTLTAEYDRISMHGVRRTLLEEQAASVGLPLDQVFISPQANNDEYETKMGAVFERYRRQGVRKIAFGDIFLQDLKDYRERHLARFDLQGLFPLWGRDTSELFTMFMDLGFHAVTTCVNPEVLGEEFLGRPLDSGFLNALPPGVDPCGENGEFHTFVFDGPLFRHPVSISLGETVRRDSFLFRDLVSV